MNKDLYESVTHQIVTALEQGVTPWVKPWSQEADPLPVNVVSERAYRGVNVLLLNLKALFAGYSRNRWLTYRQAATLGGQVRGGESGVQILYYQLRKVPARVEVYPWSDEADIPEKVIPLLRAYTVFNVAQVDGLPQPPEPVQAWTEKDAAQALVDASGQDGRRALPCGCGTPSHRAPAPGERAPGARLRCDRGREAQRQGPGR